MKKNKGRKLNKKIIYIVLLIMICNFILPHYTYALDNSGGGSLLNGVAKFLCFIPDTVLNVCQKMFVSPEKIKKSKSEYEILYSPAIIFSGTKVPAFDINFINPSADKKEIDVANVKFGNYFSEDEIIADFDRAIKEIEYTDYNGEKIQLEVIYEDKYWSCTKDGEIIAKDTTFERMAQKAIPILTAVKEPNNELKEKIETELIQKIDLTKIETVEYEFTYEGVQIYINQINDLGLISLDLYANGENIGGITATNPDEGKLQLQELENQLIGYFAIQKSPELMDYSILAGTERTYKSTAGILQTVVASWYKVFRRIALVGLLSVLVYIGIKILMSSTSTQDKAKYKRMLKDWFVALCLLFTLHYIMNFTIIIVNKVNSIISSNTNVIGENGQDVLLTTVRNTIANGAKWSNVFAQVIIYDVIVVYTIMFTIQYIKRVIHLAFLTTIAPLITLTYPLDKIKDSQAQAFDMWIKDYVFFALIQVVHLLLYYVLVASAIDLSNDGNWIYAIVAIGFLTIGEKLIKKMFGFEKSKSLNVIGEGVTGALVMNAINEFSNITSKGSVQGSKASVGSGSKNSSKGIRTANADVDSLEGLKNINLTEEQGEFAERAQNNKADSTRQEEKLDEGDLVDSQGSNSTSRGKNSSFIPISTASHTSYKGGRANLTNNNSLSDNIKNLTAKQGPKRHTIRGILYTAGRYYNPVVGTLRGVALGIVGGTIGLAAGISQGDISKAFAGLTAGTAAGYYGGKKVTNIIGNTLERVQTGKILNPLYEIGDTFREGAYGKEYADNVKFDREFRRNDGYRQLRDNDNFTDKDVQKMLDAGITDVKKMDKIFKKAAEHPRKFNIEKGIGYTTLAEKCPDKILYNTKQFIRYCQDHEIDLKPEDVDRMRKNIVEFK